MNYEIWMVIAACIFCAAVFGVGFAFGAKCTIKEIEIELKKRNGNN